MTGFGAGVPSPEVFQRECVAAGYPGWSASLNHFQTWCLGVVIHKLKRVSPGLAVVVAVPQRFDRRQATQRDRLSLIPSVLPGMI
jgi:hypothetical protein